MQPKIDVETFINLLKTNKLSSFDTLPAFKVDNIPELLDYRNETVLISDFPRNPISSFFMTECRLGVYILWTVEWIRISSTTDNPPVPGFPSLNPAIKLRNPESLERVFTEEAHQAVANAYQKWWDNDQESGLNELLSIDPLAKTDYAWH